MFIAMLQSGDKCIDSRNLDRNSSCAINIFGDNFEVPFLSEQVQINRSLSNGKLWLDFFVLFPLGSHYY